MKTDDETDVPARLTLFVCGPSKCEHDYAGRRDFEGGGTAVCTKCGAEAIAEAAWL